MKARRVKKLDPHRTLAENVGRTLLVRLDELRAHGEAALGRDDSSAQHDLRIAAKRLRYVLEIGGFCFGEPAAAARREARALQEVLGDLHDCDVMLARVDAHLARLRRADAKSLQALAGEDDVLDPALAMRAPNRTSYRGLGVLAAMTAARRETLFQSFRSLWEAQAAGPWPRLERSLQKGLGEAKAMRADLPDFARGGRTVKRAYLFARRLHGEEVAHPAEVAQLLDLAGFGEEVVAAGTLHEVLEDTGIERAELEGRFGKRIAGLVAAMTEDPGIESFPDRKAEHRQRIVRSGPAAAAIFAADKLAKLRELRREGTIPPEDKRDHYRQTFESLRASHPGLPFLAELEEELAALAERFAAA